VQIRFAPLLAVAAMTAVTACDGERIPTEPGLQGGDVEVVDGITFKKTTGPIQASYVYEGPEGYVCEAIDFEEFAHGEVITETTLFGQAVSVEITEWNDIGEGDTGTFDALVYDTDDEGDDQDIEDAGRSENLGNVLVHQEDNGSGPLGGPYTLPDDADVNSVFLFTLPTDDYLVQGFAALDQEGPDGEFIALRIDIATDGSTVGITDVTVNNDSQVEFVDLGMGAPFTETLEFDFAGSGAIDDIRICKMEEQERGEEGCTPGYWKQEHHFGNWPVNPYTTTFGEAFANACDGTAYPSVNPEDGTDICTILLLDALSLRGGGVNALARHAAAGWLNAMSSVDYFWTPAEVEGAFIAGDKDALEMANESYCPLGRAELDD
jgi:hypothetical protein